MRSEDEIRTFIENAEELTNKVRSVFDGHDFPLILAVVGKIAGEMIYEMQVSPNDEEAAEIMRQYSQMVALSYKITKEVEEKLPEGGVTH